ncbi:Periplasmic component of amino acid ABC-type transporter/signal transduction system precursor [Bosea sp. LC85]|uniref:ectoine/hydroxyectoine ABC transporter substrate-binding protein EhuB n=1 Tax=Bosea sp. LC85 TaxID=1502851 RepID=UPI0004E40641|nr:ectoine/hydroxyectoine ABC transporter substrate-binding protein EhuB [Bosea sp. LC85]KFC69335.1 Periplasmic component of amino acid ABC-type transporter/signal transduction system precursor [Bosea sp. LC85]
MNLFSRRLALGATALGLAVLSGWTAEAQQPDLSGKTITIGIHNRSPWGYRDKDGHVVGYHPDLVRAALAPLGVKAIEFTVADFGALIPGLLANRFDIIASGVAITPARCQQVLFSEPDLSAGDGLLVLKGNPLKLHSYEDIAKNPNVKLGGGRGTENAKNALAAGVPEDRLLLFPNNEAVVSAMLAGRVDAATLSAPSVAGLMEAGGMNAIERALPFKGYVKPGGQEYMMATAVVFAPKDKALQGLYNARLAKLKTDGTMKAIMAKYGFTDAEMPPEASTADLCAAKP